MDSDEHRVNCEEYYFEDKSSYNDVPSIHYSGELETTEGSTSIYIDLPLSDTVLLDIIQYAIKKLAKLKTALETLK